MFRKTGTHHFLNGHKFNHGKAEVEHFVMGAAYAVATVAVHHPLGTVTVCVAYFSMGLVSVVGRDGH